MEGVLFSNLRPGSQVIDEVIYRLAKDSANFTATVDLCASQQFLLLPSASGERDWMKRAKRSGADLEGGRGEKAVFSWLPAIYLFIYLFSLHLR